MFQILLHEGISEWDFSMAEYFFPIILLPIGVFLFWKRRMIGWILLSIFLAYSALNTIILFFMNLDRQSSGISTLEEIFPILSPAVYLMTLLFFGSFFYLICKQDVRAIFKVPKRAIRLTIVLTVFINLFFVYVILD